MQVHYDVPLAPLTTLRVGGNARQFVAATSEEEVLEAVQYARAAGLALAVLGGGSNLLVPDAGFDGLVLRVELQGVNQTGGLFDVAGGEDWDALVDRTVAAGCAGMECLAGIPGTVGASPVQNIGAYGQEVAQTVESVRALDRLTGEFVEFTSAECGFRYRESVFNRKERDRYVITRVRFRLIPDGAPTLAYAELQRWFDERAETPTLIGVATAVRHIRRRKGMVLDARDHDTWSAGSYFKNPVVAQERAAAVELAAGMEAGAMPQWAAGEDLVKLSAAWLLERAGFTKGFSLGPVALSTKHALALTNRGGATCADVLRLEGTIRAGVQSRFGVELDREPVPLASAVLARRPGTDAYVKR